MTDTEKNTVDDRGNKLILFVLQEVRFPGSVQRSGGKAAADGADGCPHVRGVREDHVSHV